MPSIPCSLASWITLAISSWIAFTPPSAAQPLPSRVVAYTGQQAPGTTTVFDSLHRPAIGPFGEIAFRGRVDDNLPGGGGRQGIWIDVDGVLTHVYLAGEASPIAGAILHDSFMDPNLTDDGLMAFGSHTDANQEAIWVEASLSPDETPTLHKVALEGEAAPGQPAGVTFGSLISGATNAHVWVSDHELVLLRARLRAADGSSIGSSLWFGDGDEVQRIVVSGEAVPQIPGATYTSIGDASLNPDGTSAFVAGISRAGGDSGFIVQRYLYFGFGVFAGQVVAATGEGLPGLDGDEELDSIDEVRINRQGQIAFSGTIRSATGSPRGYGIWVDTNATASRLYRSPQDPGGTALAAFRSFALLDDGRVVTSAVRSTDTSSSNGIFLVGPGITSRVVEGDPAPDLPGLAFEDFADIAANEENRLSFLASLSGPGVDHTNDQALFAEDAAGRFRLVAREGDAIELAPGDVRTISGLTMTAGKRGSGGADGSPRGFSRHGQVVWRANFTQGGIAILVTEAGRRIRPELQGLEAVQTIQSWNNDIRLIEGKPTLVRAHTRSDGEVANDLVLRGSRDGTELPGSPLSPVNAPPINSTEDRDHLAASTNWQLPESWLERDLELAVERRGGGPLDCREAAGPRTSDCSLSVSFETKPPLEIRLISVAYVFPYLFRVDRQARMDLIAELKSALPLADIQWTDIEVPWIHFEAPSIDQLVRYTTRVKAYDGCVYPECKTIYYTVAVWDAGPVGGRAKPQRGLAAGYVNPDSLSSFRQVISHEISHVLGLGHSVHSLFGTTSGGYKKGACGSIGAPSSVDFPNIYDVPFAGSTVTRPTLGPMESGDNELVYGYDSELGLVVPPEQFFDLMSYCDRYPVRNWPADATYNGLRHAIDRWFSPSLAQLGSPPGDALLVSGSIETATGAVELSPFSPALGVPLPPPPAAGAYSLEIHRTDGSMEQVPFEPESLFIEGEGPPSQSFFQIAVDPQPPIDRIEIRHQGTVRATRARTPTAPQVEILSPDGGEILSGEEVTVSWRATDPDPGDLTHTVQLSTDGGNTWRTVAAEWTGTSITLRRETLPMTDLGLFRVITTDGLLFDADTSNATFTLTNHGPMVEILQPRRGARFEDGQSLVLMARGFDTEDGVLGEGAFSWSSNLDGPLGSGDQLTLPVESLSTGLHSIEVTAVDAEGAVSSARRSVAVRVDPLFTDGFEDGDFSGWSLVSGN